MKKHLTNLILGAGLLAAIVWAAVAPGLQALAATIAAVILGVALLNHTHPEIITTL